MNIQIFGMKKCFDTKKAERYFKERNIKYQFIDLGIRGLSKGELQKIKLSFMINEIININSQTYKKLNLDKIKSNDIKEELLLKNSQLYKTPIVRNGNKSTIGFEKNIWDMWIKEEK
ncbi:arsenate reductase family protein [Clostridium tarantellae]|uniref:ArsC family transcriptional regulator n=1 Tax=Clostridium tarantellae TaxID=39493 RepID=A0A6I1MPD2_9CLOT|nr:ArsC/Spx/MgsR family protein [Clostridium tarantellae]MPQ44328.1 ArsC family transcriptional regulator [Clostridium tarantellae]